MAEIKKQYPYRYNEESEKLFEKGFMLYKNENPTPKFSMNQLLDICIKKAIVDYPKQVQDMNAEINRLKKMLQTVEQEKRQTVAELDSLKEKVKMKFQVDSELSKMVNLK